MIERHITFNVHPDRTAEFERFFAERYSVAMSQAPGFVRVDLLREAESPTRYQMTFRFEDGEAAAASPLAAQFLALGFRRGLQDFALSPGDA